MLVYPFGIDGMDVVADQAPGIGKTGMISKAPISLLPRIDDPCPENERGFANPTRDLRFFESTGSGPSGPKPAHAPSVSKSLRGDQASDFIH
jgi:hypothetical protein